MTINKPNIKWIIDNKDGTSTVYYENGSKEDLPKKEASMLAGAMKKFEHDRGICQINKRQSNERK